jgi:hypothetical protein
MKRSIALVLLVVLLLCGCAPAEPAADVTQPPVTSAPTTEPTTEATTEPTTEPTQAEPEKVTIYLLEKSVIYDSGFTSYHYDENYNIDTYKVHTIENDLMYTVFFEEKNADGMAAKHRLEWTDGSSQLRLLTYFADGKLKEDQEDFSTFTGYQYGYDENGNLTEKREYYEGLLCATVRYEYVGTELCRVYCEDPEGNHIFDCRVENQRIIEKVCYDAGVYSYSAMYEYDDHGNLVKESVNYDGEIIPGTMYYYKAVEVDASRAPYLLEQQKYLISVP